MTAAIDSYIRDQHNAGIAHYRNGAISDAIRCLEAAFAAGSLQSGKAMAGMALKEGRFRLGFATAKRVLSRAQTDFAYFDEFYREVIDFARVARPRYETLFHTGQTTEPVSFVICSHRDERFARVRRVLSKRMGEWPHEIVRIADARSMNEGYHRGVAKTRFERIVLCHDDIAVWVPDFAARLDRAFSSSDLFGVAGATRMSGPALLFDGHPYLAGLLYYPQEDETRQINLSVSGLRERVDHAAVLDGVFIGVHRRLIDALGFDRSCPGFHYYDIDLCHRARLAGANLVVQTDLGIEHASLGDFSAEWAASKEWFARKFPDLNGEPGTDRHWYGYAVDRDELLTVQQAFSMVLGDRVPD
jgi:hypothetical protein